ncbi:MAG: glutamine-hydrolyzing GMP synthase [Candidatus Doudnabacteria bacterium RIFCSPHIGHO2_02_FULL_48_21]|nr:MAG: glutamine-hydrolyzing GMP synthase [Candidatus Doudnabacteria bacterium RIFCSPHIGHO2_02_FULL_48_21]
MIFVLDFGSQYSHLITRRIREQGVFAELVAPNISLDKLKTAEGIILSGGPQNLSDSDALRVDKKIYTLGIPILGICYGMQLTAFELTGKVKAGSKREYGPTSIKITKKSPLFSGLNSVQLTWMSHGDQVVRLPKNFVKIASSLNCPIAAMADEKHKIYGIQFHPEVVHTTNGKKILENFLRICKAKRDWSMQNFIKDSISQIKKQIGKSKAVCALSGGVDSAIAATMVHRAIGKNLTCIYVDTGLMRSGETENLRKTFKSHMKMNLKIIDAKKEFIKSLRGITDPEKKRKTIGGLFIKIFEREAKKIGEVKWLVQGTLYTDVVSSGFSSGGKHTAVIKSHHNVGGLPEKFGFKLIEPLRDLYKYEVRKVGDELGLPKKITYRMPFPGPGLAVRIIGEVTEKKLNTLRHADQIVSEEMEKTSFIKNSQFFYFVALPDIRSVGVAGDSRTYGQPIILRAIETAEFLTADWVHLPYSLLEQISVRITNEVPGINRVVYDITSKPPATVEWE